MMRITFSSFLCLLLACSLTTTNVVALESPKEFKEGLSGSIQTTTSISQHGITWTFASPVQFGQFVNGDYWVFNPGGGVEIVNINPGHTLHPISGRHMNGSMINPHNMDQGYDGFRDYDYSKNVGIGVSEVKPLVILPNTSLVSTISNYSPIGSDSYVKSAAVLTCLPAPPPSGSFRPGISSSTKTIHSSLGIDYSKLKSLTIPNGRSKPDISLYAQYFQMVWLDHGGWVTRFMRPSDGVPDNYYYGYYFTDASLMLHLDYSNADKKGLLMNFIQLGIDLYSFIESGPTGALMSSGEPFLGWQPDGGNSNSRKWPIIFAGIMLDYAPMKNIGQKSGDYLYSNGHGPGNPPSDYIHFGEDGQTFYVTQSDVNITNSGTWTPDPNTAPNYPYNTSMIGMPEWGIKHATRPQDSDSSWAANYRSIKSGAAMVWAGDVMSVYMMGAKNLWNNNAFFDYVDRYMSISAGNPDPFGFSVDRQKAGERPVYTWGSIPCYLAAEMYDTYRTRY